MGGLCLESTKQLVLDTNVARGFGEGDVQPAPFFELRAAGVSIHLAEAAMVELLDQINTERFDWTKWRLARDVLEKILDPDAPVLLGGSAGLASNGILAPSPFSRPSRADIEVSRANMRCIWEQMRTARHLDDLRHQEGVILAHASSRVRNEKSAWVEWFDDIERAFKSRTNPEVPGLDDIAACAEVIGKAGSPRLDAFTRVALLHVFRRIRQHEPYNPKKNANDAFDLYLLVYLAFPAAVCTKDAGIHNDLIAAGCQQREWVALYSEIARPEGWRRIVELPPS